MIQQKELYWHTANDITARLIEEVSEAFHDVPALLQPCLHLIAAGGKRVRAIIPMAFCGAVCGKPENALEVGLGMELIHTFTLIHDDIMDNEVMRRGVDTVHERFGIPTAINAGNALFSLGLEILTRGGSLRTRMVTRACLDLALGQQLDLAAKKSEVSWKEYRRVSELKTAPLFSAAAGLGVLAGMGHIEQIGHAEHWGTCFGISFQVRDDALDDDPPRIHDMTHSLEEEAEMWRDSALKSLNYFPRGEWRDALEGLTNWQVTRSD